MKRNRSASNTESLKKFKFVDSTLTNLNIEITNNLEKKAILKCSDSESLIFNLFKLQNMDNSAQNSLIKELSTLKDNHDLFNMFLNPIEGINNDIGYDKYEANTYFKILLKCDTIQTKVIELLENKFSELLLKGNSSDECSLIIKQLQSIDYLVNTTVVKDLLLNCIKTNIREIEPNILHDLIHLFADVIPLSELSTVDITELLEDIIQTDNKKVIGSLFSLLSDVPSSMTLITSIKNGIKDNINNLDILQQINYFILLLTKLFTIPNYSSNTANKELLLLFEQYHFIISEHFYNLAGDAFDNPDNLSTEQILKIFCQKIEDLCRFKNGILDKLISYYTTVNSLESSDLWIVYVLVTLSPEKVRQIFDFLDTQVDGKEGLIDKRRYYY